MPALRQSVKRRRGLILLLVALVSLTTAAMADWARPATAQASVRWYNRAVTQGYFGYIRPVTSHFVHCRFQPTCSIYSIMAVQIHGFPKGLWLTVKRLCRCLPWVPMGTYDPVPLPSPPHLPASVPK